jgi:hypothetical protein
VFRVVVRLDSGATQSADYAADPDLKAGTVVKFDNGVMSRF